MEIRIELIPSVLLGFIFLHALLRGAVRWHSMSFVAALSAAQSAVILVLVGLTGTLSILWSIPFLGFGLLPRLVNSKSQSEDERSDEWMFFQWLLFALASCVVFPSQWMIWLGFIIWTLASVAMSPVDERKSEFSRGLVLIVALAVGVVTPADSWHLRFAVLVALLMPLPLLRALESRMETQAWGSAQFLLSVRILLSFIFVQNWIVPAAPGQFSHVLGFMLVLGFFAMAIAAWLASDLRVWSLRVMSSFGFFGAFGCLIGKNAESLFILIFSTLSFSLLIAPSLSRLGRFIAVFSVGFGASIGALWITLAAATSFGAMASLFVLCVGLALTLLLASVWRQLPQANESVGFDLNSFHQARSRRLTMLLVLVWLAVLPMLELLLPIFRVS
jgi:hypothetical protein